MRILLVQTAFLGDLVLSTPLIKAIKEKHPACKLWVMTTPLAKKLLSSDKELEGVIAFDKRKEFKGIGGIFKFSKELKKYNFDLVYSLHKSLRTTLVLKLAGIKERVGFRQAKASFLYTKTINRAKASHDVIRNLSLLGLTEKEADRFAELRLIAPKVDELNEDLKKMLNSFSSNSKKYVVLAPGSAWMTKRYHSFGFKSVAKHFLDLGFEVILVGGPDEVSVSNEVAKNIEVNNLVGKTNMQELLYIIANSECVVCNDSMALHVASAFKRKVVVAFCATSPEFGFGPWRTESRVVQNESLSCKPCMRHGSNKCPNGTNACMTFSPKYMINALNEIM